jgi:hypothetical protein
MQQEEDRMTTMAGGCLCGKPVFTGVCHRKNCQKSNGSAFSVVVAVPNPALG